MDDKSPNYFLIKRMFAKLTDEERLEIMSNYCKHCGSNNPKCNCWRDE